MIRRTALPRQTNPIPKRRKKARRGPAKCPAYVDWLHEQRCANCGIAGMIHGAHTKNNGMRSKGPDSSRAPLCGPCHRRYDAGRKAFEVQTGLDMQAEAAKQWGAFLAGRTIESVK